MESKLIGKKVYITNEEHWAYGEWGIIRYFDGDSYHIAIANGDEELIFDRDEFKVPRKRA